MTVLVYRDGVMAADSMAAQAGTTYGAFRKIKRINGHLVGVSGYSLHTAAFFAWIAAGAKSDLTLKGGFIGLAASPKGRVMIYETDDDGAVHGYPLKSPYFAEGSGGAVALGALAMGATAKQAAEIACRHDAACGRPIHTIRLK